MHYSLCLLCSTNVFLCRNFNNTPSFVIGLHFIRLQVSSCFVWQYDCNYWWCGASFCIACHIWPIQRPVTINTPVHSRVLCAYIFHALLQCQPYGRYGKLNGTDGILQFPLRLCCCCCLTMLIQRILHTQHHGITKFPKQLRITVRPLIWTIPTRAVTRDKSFLKMKFWRIVFVQLTKK